MGLSPHLFSYKRVEEDIILSEFKFKVTKENKLINYFGAYYDNILIGFGVVGENEEQICTLYHLYINAIFQGNGAGTALLDYICTQYHNKLMYAKFNSLDHQIELAQKFLVKKGFQLPVIDYCCFKVSRKNFENAINRLFGHKKESLLNMYRMVHMRNYTLESLRQICDRIQNIPDFLNPVKANIQKADPLCFFVYREDVLIGWIMGGVAKKEVRLHGVYILPEHRNQGKGIHLWYLCFLQANESGIWNRIDYVSFDYDKSDRKLERLYNIFFGAIKSKEIDYYITWKTI